MQDRTKYTVKAKYLVRGPNREKFQHYFCAGRGWTKDWLQVEVVLGDEDPQESYTDNSSSPPVVRLRPIMDMVTQSQMSEIMADDQNMAVRSVDVGTGEAKDLKVDVLKLMEENAKLEADVAKLKAEVDSLRTKLDESNKLLEEATKPAAELAAKVAKRKGQLVPSVQTT